MDNKWSTKELLTNASVIGLGISLVFLAAVYSSGIIYELFNESVWEEKLLLLGIWFFVAFTVIAVYVFASELYSKKIIANAGENIIKELRGHYDALIEFSGGDLERYQKLLQDLMLTYYRNRLLWEPQQYGRQIKKISQMPSPQD